MSGADPLVLGGVSMGPRAEVGWGTSGAYMCVNIPATVLAVSVDAASFFACL